MSHGSAAVCGRVPPAGAFSIPTRWPAPPRREDLVNVRVGEGGPSARLHPLEARSGFHPTGVSPRCTVGLGCVGTGAVDLTIQSDRTSAAVKSGWMGNRRLGQHRQDAPPQGVGVAFCVVPSWHRRWQALGGTLPPRIAFRLVGIIFYLAPLGGPDPPFGFRYTR